MNLQELMFWQEIGPTVTAPIEQDLFKGDKKRCRTWVAVKGLNLSYRQGCIFVHLYIYRN